MAIIAKYKFNPSLYADYLPVFNAEFTGYTKTDVNNGDGTITRTISHDTLKPTYMRFGVAMNSSTDREKSLIEVIECDTSEVTNMGNMFFGCHSLISLNVSSFDTSKVTTMQYMFNDCKLLTSLDLSNFDTSKVTNFDSIFENCTSLATINVSSWDTSKVTNMAYMFNNCNKLTSLDISNFNTSQVTSMFKMFQNCSSLTSLYVSNFNTSKVTNISNMFMSCKSLTSLDLSSFNTSNVTTMTDVFNNCSSLTSLDLSSFDTSNVTNMDSIFENCSALTSLDLSSFNTSNVTTMTDVFNNCSSLTSLDLSSFDTSQVTNMRNMFASCSKLTTLDLSNFDTSQVTNMAYILIYCIASDIGLLYATSATINSLVTALGTSVARNIYYTDAPLNELTVQNNITYKEYKITKATLPYTLNKLPNGVADYIDVVNKVHVQRVGIIEDASTLTWGVWSDNPNPDGNARFVGSIPINSLPDGATTNNATFMSNKLIPLTSMSTDLALYSVSNFVFVTFLGLENNTLDGFKAKMIELKPTILYSLATPIYTPLTEEEIAQLPLSAYKDGYVMLSSDQLTPSFEFRMRASNRYQVDMLETGYYYLNAPIGNVKLGTASVDVQQMPCIVKVDKVGSGDSGYRLGIGGEITDTTQITLAKLPSHRIPTTFTQGMKCATDFGYWEGIKVATGKQLYVNETNKLDFAPIELNRIAYGNTIVEDEFDIATGKFTKRIGKVVFDGSSDENWYSRGRDETYVRTKFFIISLPTKSRENYICINNRLPYDVGWNGDFERLWIDNRDSLVVHTDKAFSVDSFRKYLTSNPIIVYYPLEVPEISCVDLPLNILRTLDVATTLQVANQSIASYLLPQVKPSHLTYPVPSLVGNRTYTVVHNRKNITGSTKSIELNLGGTVVQLNDASSKTLVKTPSTLVHNNLIFIGGESTVDHIMVLDGDWTNKPIEYFENMKGHDTDAIITIIGDSKIDDVAEQYLW